MLDFLKIFTVFLLSDNIIFFSEITKNFTYPIVGKIRRFINSLFWESGQKYLFFGHCIWSIF